MAIDDGILLDGPAFRVRCRLLDHGTPCLGFVLEEKQHVNAWKDRLDALGFPTGAWLRELKQAVLAGQPDATPFRVWWKAQGVLHEIWFLFIGSQVCCTLLSDPASRRRPWASLTLRPHQAE